LGFYSFAPEKLEVLAELQVFHLTTEMASHLNPGWLAVGFGST
jgi:hypothetical protein